MKNKTLEAKLKKMQLQLDQCVTEIQKNHKSLSQIGYGSMEF